MDLQKEHNNKCKCNCKDGNCLDMTCECFQKGKYCDCDCPNCKNNEKFSDERLLAIEQILLQDPLAFTMKDTLNQDEHDSIFDFAMLTSSIDSENFSVERRDTRLSKLLTSEVIDQAIRTVMSAASNAIATESEHFDEKAENSVSKEFENVLEKIVNLLNPE